MSIRDSARVAREKEIFRSTGYATVSFLLDESGQTKTELHADPETLESIAHAWLARQSGLDDKKWIHKVVP